MVHEWVQPHPVQLYVGQGSWQQLANQLTPGEWLLLTTRGGVERGWVRCIQSFLPASVGLHLCTAITSNPELDHLDQLTATYRSLPLQGIIAVGGGSVLDAAKVLGVTLKAAADRPLATCFRGGHPQDWHEGLPVIALPTTSGTGAEVTPFATVWDQSTHKKYSVTGTAVFPRVALLDPEPTLTLPYRTTLYTALDALSHALESLWNQNKTPVTQAWAWQALKRMRLALPTLLSDLSHLEARTRMQEASLLAGLAISHTRTAIAHSISYPLTSYYGVPHGLACSFTLPKLLKANLENLARRSSERQLLYDLLEVLNQLPFKQELSRYLTSDQLQALIPHMAHPDRIQHYSGAPCELSKLLTEQNQINQ